MKREFILNISILILINFIVKPLYLFGVEAEVQNVVGTEQWGIYFDLFNLGYLFQIIHEPGIHSYNARNIARNPDSLRWHLPNILGLKIVLLIIYLGAVSAAFFVLGYQTSLYALLLGIGTNNFLAVAYMYLRSNISSIGRYRIDSLLSALDKVLMMIIVGFLVYNPSTRATFDIMWLVYGQMAAFLVSIVVALVILSRFLNQLTVHISWVYFRKLIKASLPYALILLFMSVYTRIDGVMLGRMLEDNNYQAGVYGACYRLLDALNMIGYLMAALLLPMFSSLKQIGDELMQLFEVGLKMMVVISIAIGWGVITYRHEILSSIYDDYTAMYYDALFPLVLGYIMISISYIYGTFLVSRDDVRKLNYIYLGGILVNVGLNLYLIPRYMAEGAAWATFVTEGALLIGQYSLVRKYKVDRLAASDYIRLALYVASVGIIGYMVYAYIAIPWMIKMVLSGFLSAVSAILLGVVQLGDIRKMRISK